MKKKIYILIFLLFYLKGAFAQLNANDTVISAFLPVVTYAFQIPGGDVALQYGNNSTIGGALKFKTNKNWLWSVEANFIFGSNIKNADSILSMVETHDHFIIDGNGTYALYSLYERGYNLTFGVGKILNLLSANPNSGVMISGGVGLLMHRMKIDNQHKTAPQINDDYGKGYDRLTGGLSLNEFVGYYYMGNTKLVNFYAGFEFIQGFTKSRRDWIFDQMRRDDSNHFDWFVGFKVGWFIPIYNRAPDKYYYY